jgi:acyl-CoA thioesterase-1
VFQRGQFITPNLGPEYGRRFDAVYPELARRNDLPLVPFLLEGVGGRRELNIEDGVHPNEAGYRIIAGTVWKTLEPVLRERAAGQP